jgi:VanZ family protein
VLIIYGSLYPWHFVPAHLTANPLRILLHSWSLPSGRYLLRDTIVNVVLYIPLGFAAHLALRKYRLPGIAVYGPVLLGLLLSTAMELMQLMVPTRETSMADVITNVIGSGLGVLLGLLFEVLAPHRGFHSLKLGGGIADRGALMLVYCWAGWLLFPLFPMMSEPELDRRLAVFAHSRLADPVLLLSAAASWYAAGLLAAAGIRISRGAFALTLLAIPAQFFVIGQQPLLSALLGAIAGVILFVVCRRDGAPTKVEAGVFLAVVLVRGLSPFHLAAGSTEFNWVPFGAMLEGDWQSTARILIQKTFYYGTAIWLLRAAGVRLVRAVMLVAAVLAFIEIAQIRLPGRTPEITDPILAILIGFVLAWMSRPVRGQLHTA